MGGSVYAPLPNNSQCRSRKPKNSEDLPLTCLKYQASRSVHPSPLPPMAITVKEKNTRKKGSSFQWVASPPETDAPSFYRDGDRKGNHRIPPYASSAELSGNCRTIEAANESQAWRSSPVPGWKRCFDVYCIVIGLPLVLPLMALIIFWIRLVSRGPALFRQERIGQDGKRFVLYKFRSMKMNSGTRWHETYLRYLVESDSPMIKLDLLRDPRLITGGGFLRASGIDELPQLLNVLRGEMSLVGPRPCLPQEYAFFSSTQRERFRVLPGLTGNWQVNGKNQSTFNEMNVMDIHYVRHASLMLDFGIMMRTPSALLLQMCQTFQQGGGAANWSSGSGIRWRGWSQMHHPTPRPAEMNRLSSRGLKSFGVLR